MKKTWKPMVAGILNIVTGASSLLGFVMVMISLVFVPVSMNAVGPGPALGYNHWFIPGFVETILLIVAVFLLIVSVLPILGGIYALQRKKWGLALAGSIAAILVPTLLGVVSTIFIAISKDEFE